MGNQYQAGQAPVSFSFGDEPEVQTSNPIPSANHSVDNPIIREMKRQYQLALSFLGKGCRNLGMTIREKDGNEYLWMKFDFWKRTIEMKVRSNESIRQAFVYYLISGAVSPKVDFSLPEPILDAEAWFEGLKTRYRRDASSRSVEVSTDGERTFMVDTLTFLKGKITFPATVVEDVDNFLDNL